MHLMREHGGGLTIITGLFVCLVLGVTTASELRDHLLWGSGKNRVLGTEPE